MAGLRLTPEDSEIPQANRPAVAPSDLISDDDRSIAADSWSIKSEYGSTLDDDQRHADAQDAADVLLSSGNFRIVASDYRSRASAYVISDAPSCSCDETILKVHPEASV